MSVYADHAAGTPTDPQVVATMLPYLKGSFGNPSSLHSFGRKTAAAVEEARQAIANFLNSTPGEIYFTSSGTESNNLAILGVARANRNLGRKIITSVIEHPSVLNACRALEKDSFNMTYVSTLKSGAVDEAEVLKTIDGKTILVTLHLANSEIGVIQNITRLSAAIKKKNPLVLIHTDACQAAAYLDLDVSKLGVDLLTFNGSKAYGPKGIAVLFVRDGVNIFPIIYGGGQEKSLRSGTENVPGIVGLAKAVEIVDHEADTRKITELRDRLQNELEKIGLIINIKNSPRLPNHLSVTFPGLNNADLVQLFDEKGIAVSAGSACSSKSLSESHVLSAIGLSAEQAQATIRISLGRHSSISDVRKIIAAAAKIKNLRTGGLVTR